MSGSSSAAPSASRLPLVAAVGFGLLVAATVAAFFIAQRLKHSPTIVQDIGINTLPTYGEGHRGLFSPNGDGRRDSVRIGFMLQEADHVTLTIVDHDGDPVKTLVDDRHVGAHKRLWGVPWDGTDEAGRPVPDGRYKIRITLRDQGRSILYTTSIVKDTTPPRPRIGSIGPSRAYGPEIWPNPDGKPITANFAPAPRYQPKALVFRTAPGRVRQVLEQDLEPGATSWTWNPAGRSPGTYLVAVQWRDPAGNIGTSVPLDRDGLPVLDRGKLPSRGGVTVRYLGARAPVTPVKARDDVELRVDSLARYSWSVRRLGAGRPVNRGGPKRGDTVRVGAPGGVSGVYLFEARTRARRTTVPFAVQARRPVAGTAAAPRGVLVVLPVMTWQGRNPVDDDGDGAPNTLTLGTPSKLYRDYAGDGLPQGFTDNEAPTLLWLDRNRRRYDLTTDAALLARSGPALAGHAGVLIPGDARWLPVAVRRQLRTFVRRGGTVVSLGTDSLRRTVTLDGKGRLAKPSPERVTDLFGARIRDVVREPTALSVYRDDPATQLFQGGSGAFPGVDAFEETVSLGDGKLLSSAVTTKDPANPRQVIVAARYGKGRVIRTGLPGFPRRLATNDDPAFSALMARMWTLLSR